MWCHLCYMFESFNPNILFFSNLQITKDHKDNKLFYVKYNCYKNIGFIYKEKGDDHLALDNLLSVRDYDFIAYFI